MARARFYRVLELNPTFYCRYQERFDGRHPLTARTDIVVEGYASAGNSFVREALLLTNPGIEVASHLHSVASLRLARERRVPAVALVREPAASVASYLARFSDSTPEVELRRYVTFVEDLARVKDYVLVVPYEQVTADFSGLVREVNRRFGASLRPFPGSPEELAARVDVILLSASRHIFGEEAALRGAMRSDLRRPLAAAVRARIEGPRYADLLGRARRAYRTSLGWATYPVIPA